MEMTELSRWPMNRPSSSNGLLYYQEFSLGVITFCRVAVDVIYDLGRLDNSILGFDNPYIVDIPLNQKNQIKSVWSEFK